MLQSRILSALALILALAFPSVGVVAPAAASAAQMPTGVPFGWGANSDGQLGVGRTDFALTAPTQATGLSGVTMLAAGEKESLALKADGTVWRWGAGSTTASVVPGLEGVTVISAGSNHNLALKSDGTVWAWGANEFGQLGDGSTTQHSTPVQVRGLANVTAIAAGNLFSLAATADGGAWSWGYNIYGALGNGSTNTGQTAARIPGLDGVVDIAGGGHFAMAMKADGTVWTWGRNDQGQLGIGQTQAVGPGSTRPVQVGGVTGVRWISAGYEHALALGADGSVWGWGLNDRGQLGNGQSGSGTLSAAPVQVAGLPAAVMVAAGKQHSLALLADGTVSAWGSNFNAELGTGQRTTTGCWCIPTPTASTISGLAYVAAGNAYSLGLQPDAPDGGGGSGSGGGTAPIPAPAPAQRGGEPPAGQYGCITFYSGNYAGDLVILGGGAYVWYDEPGAYAADASSGGISWLSGPVAGLGYGGEYRAPGTPHPAGPNQVYAEHTIVPTGTAGVQTGDLISCEREG